MIRTRILAQDRNEIRALCRTNAGTFRITITREGNYCSCNSPRECCPHVRAARDAAGILGEIGIPHWQLGDRVIANGFCGTVVAVSGDVLSVRWESGRITYVPANTVVLESERSAHAA